MRGNTPDQADFIEEIWPEYMFSLKSDNSRKVYLSVVRNFTRTTGKQIHMADIDDARNYFKILTKDVTAGYVKYNTMVTRLRILRRLGDFMQHEYFPSRYPEYKYDNPFVHIALKDTDHSVSQHTLPAAGEIAQAIKYLRNNGNVRMALIIALAAKCGIALRELISLDVTSFTVNSKDSKLYCVIRMKFVRYVMLPDDVLALLEQYLQEYERATGPLFITKHGTRLTEITLERNLKKIMQELMELGFVRKVYKMTDLRNAAFIYMLSQAKTRDDKSDVAKYCGVTDRWIDRYKIMEIHGTSAAVDKSELNID